ncbi:hypothetical protein IMY05_014G0037800 [Salix suchowensis]|nr:hypothetical protein IMY05_014G0037800 [Salix suchowensis]
MRVADEFRHSMSRSGLAKKLQPAKKALKRFTKTLKSKLHDLNHSKAVRKTESEWEYKKRTVSSFASTDLLFTVVSDLGLHNSFVRILKLIMLSSYMEVVLV